MNELHCDAAIRNSNLPNCLRYYLLINRLAAMDKNVVRAAVGDPKCFATYQGKRVRLVMASRFGDVGITENLGADSGYERRVSLGDLSDFSAEE